MKRLVIFLVALALLAGSLPLFAADVTIKEDFIWVGNYNPDLANPNNFAVGKARLKFDGKADDFNSLYIELRAEGLNWGGYEILPGPPAVTIAKDDFYLKQFKLTSDLTGALGLKLPVTVKATIGRWDEYFTGWYYYDQSGWEFYYGGPNQPSFPTGPITSGASWANLVVWAPESNGAIKLDVGVMDKVNLHYYQDFQNNNMMLAADASFMGAGLWVAYGVPFGEFGSGNLAIEGKYDVELAGLKLGVAPYFRYTMANVTAAQEKWTWGAEAKVAWNWIQAVAGLQGDSYKSVDHILAELNLTPIPKFAFVGALYLDYDDPLNPLHGVDLRASYKFGAANFMVGWLIGGQDKYANTLYNDTFALVNGLYFGADCSL